MLDGLLLYLVPTYVLGVLEDPEIEQVFELNRIRAPRGTQHHNDMAVTATIQELAGHVRPNAVTCQDSSVPSSNAA